MISTLIALPYELMRKPLAAADARLTDKLPEPVGARLGWALGSADKLAGTALRHPGIAQRGTERLERSSKLLTANRLEDEAQTRREQARQEQAAGRREAARKRQAAQERAAHGFKEADEAELRDKREAQDDAEKAAASKKAAANERAASRRSTAERRKEQVTSVAEATQQIAQGRTKAELADARESKRAADEARDDAERLSELTAAKKQQRQED